MRRAHRPALSFKQRDARKVARKTGLAISPSIRCGGRERLKNLRNQPKRFCFVRFNIPVPGRAAQDFVHRHLRATDQIFDALVLKAIEASISCRVAVTVAGRQRPADIECLVEFAFMKSPVAPRA